MDCEPTRCRAPGYRTFALAGCAIVAAFSAAKPVFADYPVMSHRYLADPGAMVHDGRVYVYCSNDDENPVDGGYSMKSIVCVSSSDMKNWTDHGVVFRVPEGAAWATHSWAPAAIARNGKFYLYFGNNASGIGVASSDSPTGPFTDAKGGYLINSATPGVLPATNIWIFDPAVFIDGDNQAWLYFGGNGEANVRIIRLNEDMISTSGDAIQVTVPYFFEAAWMHKRAGKYYFSYSTNPSNGLRIDYLTGDSPTGPFTYGGIVAGQPPSNNNNNHASIVELNGKWYHIYHNRYVATQAGIPTVYRRNIAVESLDYNPDGSIVQATYTLDGVEQAGWLDPFSRVEAETMNAQSGIETEVSSEGGMDVTNIDDGDWTRVRGVNFGSNGAVRFNARVASAASGGTIGIHLDAIDGPLAGTCTAPVTGGAQTWTTVTCDITGATGVHDLYFEFTGPGTGLFNFDWWQFEGPQPPVITVQPRPLTVIPGDRATLWVESDGTAPFTYQWMKDGSPVTGATHRFLEIAAASAGDVGDYSIEITNAAGMETSSTAKLAVTASSPSVLANLSVRSPLHPGQIVIPGFFLAGSGSRPVLIRAVGPTLADYSVNNAHPDPAITVFSGSTGLLTNDNWADAPNASEIEAAMSTLGAFALPADSKDAAAYLDLTPGPYTTHIADAANASGNMLFELYSGNSATSRLVNVSALADNGTGEDIMILGFFISGSTAKSLLIRAVGPSLEPLDVHGWLEDPVLTLYQGIAPILSVDDWGDTPDPAALATTMQNAGAFPLAENSTDAAVAVTLMPGSYTALARGHGATTGKVIVEVYDLQ